MPHLPLQFLNAIGDCPGLQMQNFIEAHEKEEKVTSVRFNPFKPVELDFQCASAVPWSQNACYLGERPSFTLDPLFHAGCYYVQEAGSMFLEHAVRSWLPADQPFNILDVCAAPGGKSTLLNSLLPAGGLLVSNEVIKSRSRVLADQLGKWGQSNTIVLNMDPSQLSPITSNFDLVVVDAPCSGSGLFRKQPEALSEWSPAAVDACCTRQKNILGHLIPGMKAGAFLFYSTCSYSIQENEEVVEWLQKEYGLQYRPLPIEKDWGIVDSGAGYRFYPDQTRSEGFFCALLQKSGEQNDRAQRRKEPAGNLKKEEQQIIMDFVGVKMEDLIQKNGFIYSMPEQVRRFLNAFEGRLYVRKAGLCLGELKGRDLVPAHELALSTGLLFHGESLELEKEEALRFLRKDVMAVGEQRKGFVRVHYKKQGIGWIKLLGNRVNNYLPNESRILKQD